MHRCAGATVSFICINCRSKTDPGFRACPYCGDPITDFLRQYTEEPIDGKYKILSRLGIGGMGEVYKVLHLHLNSPRVVKLMRPNLSAEERAHERFIREAQLATKIQHPNVATLFDFSTLDDGSYYMVWEYIDGVTIAELIRARGFLSPKYAATLSIQVLEGLQAIHRRGVVHRDMSPENVMLTYDDEDEERIKIIDMGIAKQWTDETDDKTKTGMFVGKWKYCSPEQLGVLKPGERIDGRADLYSYAIVLYEMLTGRVPFIADSPHRFLLLHSTANPPPLAESNPKLGDVSELEAVLFRALDKDRDKRFRSARQFASALEKILPSLSDAPGLPNGAARPDIDTLEESHVATEPLRAEVSEEEPSSGSGRRAYEKTVDLADLELKEQDVPFLTPDRSTEETVEEDANATIEHAPFEEEDSRSGGRGIDDRTLNQALPEAAYGWGSERSLLWISLAALILVALVFGLLIHGGRDGPVAAADPIPAAKPSITTVGIHAWPWGTIEELRNLDTGQAVELPDAVTPIAFDLAPGRYRVTLVNPRYEKIQHSFGVRPGEPELITLQFESLEEIEVPDLGRPW
jgi:serine/threonine protein kinase